MRFLPPLLLIAAITIYANANGQNDSLNQGNKGQFVYNYDNDVFTATDRYYTQGVRFDLISPTMKKLPTSFLLISHKNSSQKLYGIAIDQNCFTPRSIRYDTIKIGERPFSGNIFLSHFLISNSKEKKERIFTKIDIGAMGPCAMCEQEQKGIHKLINNIQPLGWEYQLKNHVFLNYTLGFEKGIIAERNFEFIVIAQTRIGTVYNDVGLGSIIRIGKMNSYFNSFGTISLQKTKFQVVFFMKSLARIIGYNATLQGGLFNKNDIYVLPASQITRTIATITSGISFTFKKFALEYALNWISPEFTNGLFHGWGHYNLIFGF